MGSRLSLLVSVSCAALVLAGCEDGEGLGSSRPDAAATAAADRPAATRLVERDVEAPEVFQQTEAGLWDGRPSLGGVWVAHPDVDDPERVIIRNESNGQFVIGALFRRERDNPGPRFQVSSDAAATLGMLAGAPTRLNVTALRREEAQEPEPEAQEAPVAVDESAEEAPAVASAEPETGTASTEPVVDIAIVSAAAAIDRAESSSEATPSADTAGEGATLEEQAVAAAGEEPRARWNPFRRNNSEPMSAISQQAEAAAAGTVVSAAATATVASSAAAVAPESGGSPERTAVAESAPQPQSAPTELTTASDGTADGAPRQRNGWNPFRRRNAEPLSAVAPVAVAGATAGAIIATPEIETQALPSATQASARSAPAAATSLDQPFVQLGIFSVEENADETAALMRRNGVVPTIYEQESQGKTFWRVVVGPAKNGADRSALLRKVRGLGFADAYAVAR